MKYFGSTCFNGHIGDRSLLYWMTRNDCWDVWYRTCMFRIQRNVGGMKFILHCTNEKWKHNDVLECSPRTCCPNFSEFLWLATFVHPSFLSSVHTMQLEANHPIDVRRKLVVEAAFYWRYLCNDFFKCSGWLEEGDCSYKPPLVREVFQLMKVS